MCIILISLFSALFVGLKSRLALQTEILALRHQIVVLKRSAGRPILRPWDRFLWIWLLRYWPQWRSALVIVKMVRHPKPPSQTWRAFLKNHAQQLASVDFFTVPTISFRILYVFLVLSHERRRVIHFNVTSHPTADWTCRQLLHAFPFDSAPQYIIRDRDGIYGEVVQRQLKELGIQQVLTAPRSPWQSPYIERLIGSIRRECLDHIIAINEASLRATLRSYFSYYHDSRCHLGLNKDSPEPRQIQLPDTGRIAEIPKVGGLHHRYERRAA
jgi:putative transposase